MTGCLVDWPCWNEPGELTHKRHWLVTCDGQVQDAGIGVAAELYRHDKKGVQAFTRRLSADIIRQLDEKFTAIDKANAAMEVRQLTTSD